MPAFPPHPFWDFSLALYGRPGVAEACLKLQERHGLDVNIVLFCLWSAADGRAPLGAREFAAILERAGEWHENVVRPLRGTRRRMKEGAEGLELSLVLDVRKKLAGIEIDCEHLEQLAIAAAAGPGAADTAGTPAAERARANVDTYLTAVGVVADAEDRQVLERIIEAM
ncbi:TIGR02444 family protein [Afifella sp. IM 167]|uniref:TIGR02444 family protein n=1 Tax=Afifella sp. IM 167 TaxID=2033586 RepID=UPI001CCAB616|nr:TIGR02444 family protein [Afifella sp. IM 167]MBZ8134356.1 TIGR02444 family protein [Afifella sp. IM 167]